MSSTPTDPAGTAAQATVLREQIDHMKRLAYGAAPQVVMDIADDVARMERQLAELEAK